VKRAYTRKVVTKEQNVRVEGGDVGRQYDDEVPVPHPVNVARVEVSPSQAYALRVWSGQSVDVPVAERCERVRNALRGQNLPIEGVVLEGVVL
jgi:hypothetical protein